MPPQQKNVTKCNLEIEAQKSFAHANAINFCADVVQSQKVEMNSTDDIAPGGSEKQEKSNEEDTIVANETFSSTEDSKRDEERKKEVKLMEKEVECEAIDESVGMGEDGEITSVKEIVLKDRTPSALDGVALPRSVFEVKTLMENSAVQGISSTLLSTPDTSTIRSIQDQGGSFVLATTPTALVSSPAPASATLTPETAIVAKPDEPICPSFGEEASFRSIPQSVFVNLEKLLQWFPTTDRYLMEMLATRIEEALVIEDALICARIGKCQELSCRSVLMHYEHCKDGKFCGDPKCEEISIVYHHRRTCSKKGIMTTSDGTKFLCPFCIRIQQRRSLGVVAALDHLISDQYRALQRAHSEAARNFCLQSINTWSQRKQILRAEIDHLNQLARESSALVFNFPRYQWHFGDAVSVKREPILLESENNTTGLSAPEPCMSGTNGSTATEESSSMRSEDETNLDSDARLSEDIQKEIMTKNVSFDVNFINELLWAKDEDDGKELSQRRFDKVMELGYAIVDASFCAPSKAQQCLLNCKAILLHLQHHLDLQVCTQTMCAAVEHHFSHLSQCKARDDNESCEYCLRVEERQLIRSVDSMEAEQPEAEAEVQNIINAITASFTNHQSDEREQEVIQLEDELEQAEANKQELLEKLSAARMNLRKVRRRMERYGISTSISRQLPVHFVQVRRAEGSSNRFKKRRRAGSLD
ncbi:unnamed protein product [Peronospora belbahrii]|uniref:TAZ-type domain-containing protein n=1 Tax=Peronospora belbahrii TaxID=622444 RepID=A0AAU9KS60_9STRA|nr:unnamed protein product [Peronospora belbahrii]